ncbi:dihydroxyacetone kinase DhaL subunit [Prosthecobacter fusiformis]|uniref:Dihydroxyacetone kinase DhaL subunit n=1 Tax=Prosthecobacter fusiformis TaxID=48464 RepID=A0A4R7S4F0_9BACT|nr:dihydroxyacetone kinase subunit DhaL [Prosthecobacter fusiformis]TDU73204.1 dihydroxyacetone kinase DhaL subunit [Prosthecobacter fusiformis]
MELTPNQVRLMMLQVADAIIEAEPMLSQADRDLGDGDHGLGMKRGMEEVKAKLEPLDAASVEQVFVTTGSAMMSSMGGASGALFGTVYRAGGKAVTGRESLDAEGLSLFLQAALEGVMKRGGAKPGDKTMIDALAPAADKAKEVASQPLPEALTAIVAAAEAGVEASKAMIAQFGRAKTLGEACLGFPDAGALSVTIMLKTMLAFVKAD